MGCPFRLSRLVSSCRADPVLFKLPLKQSAKFHPVFCPGQKVLMFDVSPTSSAGELSAWRNIEH